MKYACRFFFFLLIALAVSTARVAAAETAGKGFPLRTSSSATGSASAQSRRAAAETVAPAQPAAVEAAAARAPDFENQPLAFAGPRRRPERDDESRGFVMPSVWPALLAVVGVCGLFCAGLYFVKRYIPGHRQLFSHPAMEVLGRTHLDQRRYVSLLRVGKRIVVVGVSPDDMRPLSEITDEEEITGILEVARPKTEAGLTIFQRLFQRTVVDAEAAETRAMADEKAKQLDAAMSSLRQRVAEIKTGGNKAEPRKRQHVDTVG